MYPDPRIWPGSAMMPSSEHQRTCRHAALIDAGVGMQAHEQFGHVARCRQETAITIKRYRVAGGQYFFEFPVAAVVDAPGEMNARGGAIYHRAGAGGEYCSNKD
jgi:hypothetical protein